MNNIDFKILKDINPTTSLGLTEIYVGHVEYPWHYAIAEFSADRTEGVPFDVFDKVICSLLKLDGKLSIFEIGDILGLNIENKVYDSKYQDLAEYEILTEKLSALLSYGLIEFNQGSYSLTKTGEESLSIERKFRKIRGYDFSLYFDLTGNQHYLAKTTFLDAARTTPLTPSLFKYDDENLIKSFVNDQIPNFFRPEDGNSFSNLKMAKVEEYTYSVYFGVIYDFLKKTYRLVCYNPMNKCGLFSKSVDETPGLMSKILDCFFNNQPFSSLKMSSVQQLFEDTAIETQASIEYDEYMGQDTTEKRKNYHDSETIIIPEIFWASLTLLLSSFKANKICLHVDYLTSNIIEFIKYFVSQLKESKVFLSYGDKEEIVSLDENDNFYMCQIKSKDKQLCSIDDHVVFESGVFIYDFKGQPYERPVIIRPQFQYEDSKLFESFVGVWLPEFLQSFVKILEGNTLDGHKGLVFLRSLETKLEVFKPYLESLNLTKDFETTVSKRDSILKKLTLSHIETLKNKLLELTGIHNFENLKNINEVTAVYDKLSQIENECFEDYTEVKTIISSIKKLLKDRENYIRDIKMAKTFIIDTNIFLYEPDILSKIKMPNKAVICAKVTDELDKHKMRTKENDDLHLKAQKALRNINQALKKDKSKVVKAIADITLLPKDFTDKSADNRILCVALMYKDKNPCLLTSDNGLQVKAQICDIPTKNLQEFFEMQDNLKAEREKRTESEKDTANSIDAKNKKSKKNKYKPNKKR